MCSPSVYVDKLARQIQNLGRGQVKKREFFRQYFRGPYPLCDLLTSEIKFLS